MDRPNDGEPIILEGTDAMPPPEPEIEVLPARFRIRDMHIPGEINPYAPQRHFHMTLMDDEPCAGEPAGHAGPAFEDSDIKQESENP